MNKAKRKMGRVMQTASLSLAEVTYATGDISYLVQEQAKSASFKVKAKQENVSGVVLPAFEVDRVAGSGTFLWPIPLPLSSFLTPSIVRRLQPHWSWTWWTAGFAREGGVCEGGGDVGRPRLLADCVHDPR